MGGGVGGGGGGWGGGGGGGVGGGGEIWSRSWSASSVGSRMPLGQGVSRGTHSKQKVRHGWGTFFMLPMHLRPEASADHSEHFRASHQSSLFLL